jgi:EmrB/QacA subfamily drug resistance transporter
MKLELKWQVLIIICLGIFMSTLDSSIVNIANPTIAEQFSVTMNEIQWIVTAYMLVITASLIFFGKMGDKIGNNRIFAWGFLIFTAGSFLCSLAASLIFLIAARIIQAFGASMMMATGIGIVSNTFPADERGKALGITGSIVGIGNMTGPSLGGLLVANFSWPIIFIINVPIGLLGFYLAVKFLPTQPVDTKIKGYDKIGTLLFAVFAVILISSLSLGEGIVPILFFISLLVFIIFYFFEENTPSPMLDFELFKVRNFVFGNIMAFASYISQNFVLFLMPFYMEKLLHYSPSLSGLFLTITPVAMAITAPLAGSLSDRIGSGRLTSISFILTTSAHLIFSTLDYSVNVYKIIGGLLLLGIGMGSFGSPNSSSILGSIPREKAGYAGGFMSTVRNLSFSLGIALSASMFTLLFNTNQKFLSYTQAYASATGSVYRIAALITFSGLIISLISSRTQKAQVDPQEHF